MITSSIKYYIRIKLKKRQTVIIKCPEGDKTKQDLNTGKAYNKTQYHKGVHSSSLNAAIN